MKKNYKFIILILVFTIIVSPIFAKGKQFETISICSWNINTKDSDEIISTISKIAKEHKINIFLLQEVKIEQSGKNKSLNFLNRLKTKLNQSTQNKWDFFSSLSYAIRKNIDDYVYCAKGQDNAIFYCTDKFDATDMYKKYGLDNFLSTQYKTDKNHFQIIKFKIKKSKNKNLYIINLHLPYNNKHHTDRDLRTIATVFDELPKSEYKIMAGDFNMSTELIRKTITNAKAYKYTIGITEETTLSNTKLKFASSYDHFIYSDNIKHIIQKQNRLAHIKKTKIILGNSNKNLKFDFFDFRKKNSDHSPIYLSFKIPA